MLICILTDENPRASWHVAQLQAAFAAVGVQAHVLNLSQIVLNFDSAKPVVMLPHPICPSGQGALLPHACLVRGIAGGSLQQITTRLNVLHMLAMQGARVVNSGRAIERTVDKAMTTFLLAQAGIATPPTWVCEGRNQAHEIINNLLNNNQKIVLKPLFGSQGKGMRLLDNASAKPLPFDAHVDGVFYMQQFIPAARDYRVLVVNNEPIAAMQRVGEGWLNNVAQGAQCQKIADADVLQIAVQAAKALEIDYCGVDILRDDQGKLWVIEVNSIPAWRGLQGVTSFNIADALAGAVLQGLQA